MVGPANYLFRHVARTRPRPTVGGAALLPSAATRRLPQSERAHSAGGWTIVFHSSMCVCVCFFLFVSATNGNGAMNNIIRSYCIINIRNIFYFFARRGRSRHQIMFFLFSSSSSFSFFLVSENTAVCTYVRWYRRPLFFFPRAGKSRALRTIAPPAVRAQCSSLVTGGGGLGGC